MPKKMLTRLPSQLRSRNRRGFSLTELMLAIAIMAIVAIVMINLFSNFVNFFVSDDEKVLSRQRGMDAIRLLEIPVLHTGLGIPTNVSPDRTNAFQNTFPSSSNAPFRNWGTPINISGANRDNLRILYAVESGVFQLDEDENAFFDYPLTATLKLTGALDTSKIMENTPANTHSWITFPGQSLPMYVASGLSTLTPTVNSFRLSIQGADYNEKIRAFNEVLYINAIRVWVDSADVLHVMEVTTSDAPGSGPEQTIPGVLRVQFATDSRTLSMDLLTRGDTRDTIRVDRLKSSRPDLISRWNLTDAEMEYTLDEVSMQWRIRNYEYN